MMDVVAYVQTQVIPTFPAGPKECLMEMQKWNNILTFKKSSEEVKEVRSKLNEFWPTLFGIFQRWLDELGKAGQRPVDFVKKWKEGFTDFQNIKELMEGLSESIPEESVKKLAEYEQKLVALMRKQNQALEEELAKLKNTDRGAYDESLGKRLEFSIEDEIYPFANVSEKSEEMMERLGCLKSQGLEGYMSEQLSHEVEEMVQTGRLNTHIKQILQNFIFTIEKSDECLLDIIKSDSKVHAFLKCLKSKQQKEWLSFSSLSDQQSFVQTLVLKGEEAVRKIKDINTVYANTVNSFVYLDNFKLYRNHYFWRMKIEQESQQLVREIGVDSLSDPKVKRLNQNLIDHLAQILGEKLRQTGQDMEAHLDPVSTCLRFQNYTIVLENQPEELQKKFEDCYTDFAKKTFELVAELKFFGESDRKQVVKTLHDKDKVSSKQAFEVIKEVVKKVKTYMDDPREIEYVNKLKQMQDFLKGKETKQLNALEEIIRKVDKIQVQVDCLPDERTISNKVSFKFDKFKDDVFKAIVEIKENIGSTIKDNLNEDVQNVDNFILGTQNFLKKKVNNIGELEDLKKEYTEVTKKFNEVDQDIKGLDKKIKIINDFGFKGTNHINLANLRRKWDNFAVKFSCFTYTIKSSEGQIKKKVKGELEKMTGEIDKFYAKIQSVDLRSTDNMTKDQEVAFSSKLKEIRREWEEIQKVLGDSLVNADQYEVDLSDMKSLQAIRDYFKGPFAQWMVYFEFLAGLEKMEKEQWITFKYNVYDFQKYIIEWEEKVRSANSSSTRFVHDQCNLYLEIWPALKSMIGDGFQRNHWTDLFALINLPKNRPFNEITFGEILGKKDVIQRKVEDIKFLAARAQGEVALREALADLQSWCENTQFVFYEFTDQQKIILNLVKEWTDILTEVGDNQAILQNISDSKFCMNFTDQIEMFQNKLGGLDDMLLKLNLIQRKWIYLEPVFGRGALPNEQGRFRRIDDEFRSIIQALNNEPLVVTLSSIPSVAETLDMLLDQLERCQKALNSYLEEKRNVMPRFYFLGDDDLLELLGQSQNVGVIHSHLKKLFSGIVKLKVNEENKESTKVEHIASSKGEQVKLQSPVVLSKDVESWLGNLSDAMNLALSGLLKQSIKNTDTNIDKYPGQLLEISDSVHFTKKAETSIQAGKLEEFKKEMNDKLSSLTSSKSKLRV
jgi:dynein heavy chain 2